MKLYELSDDYRKLQTELDNEETEQDSITAILSQVKEQFDEKVENIGKLILSLKADAEAVKLEEQRLAKRRKTLDEKAEWLKGYLQDELTNTGVEKVKGVLLTVSLRKNPPSINVVDVMQIPDRFWRVIPEVREPDKKAIIEQFKATGEIIDGVEIVTDKKHLEIK